METNQLHVIKRIQERVQELEELIQEPTVLDDLEKDMNYADKCDTLEKRIEDLESQLKELKYIIGR